MSDRRHVGVVLEPPTPIRSSDPRQRILDALVQTIALRGYDRTTIDRVLHIAEVPAPVFDEHFADKQDCLLVALDELIGRIECAVLEQIDGRASWSERVRIGSADAACGARLQSRRRARGARRVPQRRRPAIARLRAAVASFVPLLEEGQEQRREPQRRLSAPANL